MSMHSVAEARDQFSSLINRALKGGEVVITRHGHPVVGLKAVERRGRPMIEADIQWLRERRVGRRIPGVDAGQFVSDMRDEDDERLLRR